MRELLANGENPKIRRTVPPDFLFNTLFERWIERRKNEVSAKCSFCEQNETTRLITVATPALHFLAALNFRPPKKYAPHFLAF